MPSFAKSIQLRLDYTNYFAWRLEIVRCALKMANCAHFNCDGGGADKLEELLYERPEAPAAIQMSAIGQTGAIVHAEATLQQRTQHSQKKLKYKNDMEA